MNNNQQQNPFAAMMDMMQQMAANYGYQQQPQQNPNFNGFQPQQPNFGQQPNMQGFNPQPHQQLPVGVTGIDHQGVFVANSVNDLASWNDYVKAKDGGTYAGIRVYFCNMEELRDKPSDRDNSNFKRRKTEMARFEICRPSGRNPLNSVINLFMKDKYSHVPYLDPKNWDSQRVTVEFRNIDDNRIIPYRLECVTFMGEMISDDLHKRCKSIVANSREMLVYKMDGKEWDEDGEYASDAAEQA